MNDLISRQDVLDKAYAYGNGLEPEGFCVDVEDIQALPSVEPEQRWIPMTEQLPKNGYYYLWCSDAGSVQMDYYFNDEFEHGREYGYNIVAWMPLPEPWKGEEDE